MWNLCSTPLVLTVHTLTPSLGPCILLRSILTLEIIGISFLITMCRWLRRWKFPVGLCSQILALENRRTDTGVACAQRCDLIYFPLCFLLWYLVRLRQISALQTAMNSSHFDDAPLCFAINWKYSFIKADLLDLKLSLKSFCARSLRFKFRSVSIIFDMVVSPSMWNLFHNLPILFCYLFFVRKR